MLFIIHQFLNTKDIMITFVLQNKYTRILHNVIQAHNCSGLYLITRKTYN